jgi:hypothetical protein
MHEEWEVVESKEEKRRAQKALEERTSDTKSSSSGEIFMRYWVAGVEDFYGRKAWLQLTIDDEEKLNIMMHEEKKTRG